MTREHVWQSKSSRDSEEHQRAWDRQRKGEKEEKKEKNESKKARGEALRRNVKGVISA